MSKAFSVFLVLTCLWCCFSVGCSGNGPTASGTEVGNPEITVAAAAVLDLARDDSSWRLSRYVDASLLDPNPVVHPKMMLAKTVAEECSVMVIDSFVTVDTIYRQVPVIINDTVLAPIIQRDTILSVVGGDTLVSISESRGVDTLVVRDTVITRQYAIVTDTIYGAWKRPCRSFIYGQESAHIVPVPENKRKTEPGAELKYDSTAFAETTKTPLLQFSNLLGEKTAIAARNVERIADTGPKIYALSKSLYLADGTEGVFTYTDADSDGLLLDAAVGAPRVNLSGRWQGISGLVVLEAQFDGGLSNDLSATEDNRILTFKRFVLSDSDTLEASSYPSDSGNLHVAVRHGADSLVRSFSSYSFSDSEPATLPVSVERSLFFQAEEYVLIDIKAESVKATAVPMTFDFTTAITGADGSQTVLSGSVNAGGLIGEFEKDGKRYSVGADLQGTLAIREIK